MARLSNIPAAEDTRVFREVSQIGRGTQGTWRCRSSAQHGSEGRPSCSTGTTGTRSKTRSARVRDKRYHDTVSQALSGILPPKYRGRCRFPGLGFQQLRRAGRADAVHAQTGVRREIEAFVAQGGTFVTTTTDGLVDETDLAFENGYPGPLQRVLGIWVEEIDALYEKTNTIVMAMAAASMPAAIWPICSTPKRRK